MQSKHKVWLITGAAGGLGRKLVERALAAGDAVVATCRQVGRLRDLAEAYPDSLHSEELDVADSAAAQAAVDNALRRFGVIDVLVCNAGYGRIAPFEETPADDFRSQIEVNFFGVVNLVRATLPSMRKRRSGVIINVSSSAGRVAAPGMAAYCAAKSAVGGFSEALAQESAAFGVRVVAVEPGSIRTNWTAAALDRVPEFLPDYETVSQLAAMAAVLPGNEPGDPARYADVIFTLSRATGLPRHLVLGPDAIAMVEAAESERAREQGAWRSLAVATDYRDTVGAI
jgi:NAD(P)-dependent dehydrogenase (short-subunit alcohol dehydrogenase family)